MISSVLRAAAKRGRVARPTSVSRIALLVLVLGAVAYGGQISIFRDDFEGYNAQTNPGTPPVGEPWQVTEAAPEGLSIRLSGDPPNQSLLFHRYRNIALAPFSAQDRQRIALERNASIRFDYLGLPNAGSALSHYFDIGAYAPASTDPAFLLRISPQEDPGANGLHDVLYLDPAGGLRDSGLDIHDGVVESFSIDANFAAGSLLFGVTGSSVSLPMFTCPEEVVGVQFANYAIGSGGTIDNLSVFVAEPDAAHQTPELASLWMVLAGVLSVVGVWAVQRYAK